MPGFAPTIYPNTSLAPGINQISAAVQEWQRKQEEDQKQLATSDALVWHAANGKLISPAEYNAYQSAPPAQKPAIAAGYAINMHDDFQRQQRQDTQDQLGFVPAPDDFDRAGKAGYALLPTGHGRYKAVPNAGGGPNEPGFAPTPQQIEEGRKVGVTWFPTSRGQGRWVQDPNNPVNSPRPKPIGSAQDTLEGLDKDVRAVSGAPLAAFLTGSNHRIVGDQFVVDTPGIGMGKSQMPVPMYQHFRDRYDTINGAGATPGTQAPGVDLGGGSATAPLQTSQVDATVALNQARAKIQAGADPTAVKDRLQQLGVDSSGL